MRLRRQIAELICRLVGMALPTRLHAWGEALRHEVAGIDDDHDALRFAFHGLFGLLPRALLFHLLQPLALLASSASPATGSAMTMRFFDDVMDRPRAVGIGCAIAAVTLGLVYLTLAGAPTQYLAINGGALCIGLAALALIGRTATLSDQQVGAMTLAMGLALLATALFGHEAEGAARWIKIGPLFVQPSLVLLPLMIVCYARARTLVATGGMIVAAVAMALQPDRAMAGMLAIGLTGVAILRPGRQVTGALAASLFAFAATLVRRDDLPAMPHVDQVLYSSFGVHTLAGLAVFAGTCMLIVPAIVGAARDPQQRHLYWTFGLIWLAAVVAAALGNYPTPVVGYGGSAVLGYLLSLAMLPKVTETARAGGASSATMRGAQDVEGLRLVPNGAVAA